MASYKDRVKADLDRWIGAGLVSADKRDAILATLPDARRLDAATALAWVGALLFGIAVIAFIAANWDALAKLARFMQFGWTPLRVGAAQAEGGGIGEVCIASSRRKGHSVFDVNV